MSNVNTSVAGNLIFQINSKEFYLKGHLELMLNEKKREVIENASGKPLHKYVGYEGGVIKGSEVIITSGLPEFSELMKKDDLTISVVGEQADGKYRYSLVNAHHRGEFTFKTEESTVNIEFKGVEDLIIEKIS